MCAYLCSNFVNYLRRKHLVSLKNKEVHCQMKCKKLIILFTMVLVSLALVTGGNIGLVHANYIVDVTDYGAKDFVAPVTCQLNGTNTIVATNGIGNLSVGDYVRITNGTQSSDPGTDLYAKINAINGNQITLDKTCGSSITTDVYIDSTQAFKDAFNYANSNSYLVFIPEGNYFVVSDVKIQTDVTCSGWIYTSNKGTTPLFRITHKYSETIITPPFEDSLKAGTDYLPELAQYAGCDIVFDSGNPFMYRNNGGIQEICYKEETNRILSGGHLLAGLAESYDDHYPLQLVLFNTEDPITVDGLNIKCIDNTITSNGKAIVMVSRSDVTLDDLVLINDNLSTENGQRCGVNISYAVNVTLNNPIIQGFNLNGLGYGVSAIKTLNTTLNNARISDTRHAVTGNGDNHTTINGGTFGGYGGTIDSHWGHNFSINDATIYGEEFQGAGGKPITYAGNNLSIDGCDITTEYRILVSRRSDTPFIGGDLTIEDTTITYTGDSQNNDFTIYRANQTDFDHKCDLYNPNLIMENVTLYLDDEINKVNLYDIDHDIDTTYEIQVLPELIQVYGLSITGIGDTALNSTAFQMMPATNKYYLCNPAGDPEAHLENISVNKSTGSGSIDGNIIYSYLPENNQDPNVEFNMHISNCGKLSFDVIPEILGDIFIENCEISTFCLEH